MNCTLGIVNVLLAISGKILTYYGITVISSIRTYFDAQYELLPLTITCIGFTTSTLGVVTVLISWFGCCIDRNVGALKIYALLLGALLTAKTVFTIALHTNLLQNAGKTFVNDNFNSLISNITIIEAFTVQFLEEIASELRRILIFFIILEIMALFCAWYSIRIKIEEEQDKIASKSPQAADTSVTVQAEIPNATIHLG